MNKGVRETAESGAGRNILVTADIDRRALNPPTDAEQTDRHTIAVVPSDEVGDWIDANADHLGHDTRTVISVGGHDDPKADSEPAGETAPGDSVDTQTDGKRQSDTDADTVPVVTTAQSDELAPICKAIYDALERTDGTPVHLHVQALDDILKAVPLRSAFILLVALTAMADRYNAHATYYLDPNTHHDGVLPTLAPLFDEHVA